jgi:hypothetical protein
MMPPLIAVAARIIITHIVGSRSIVLPPEKELKGRIKKAARRKTLPYRRDRSPEQKEVRLCEDERCAGKEVVLCERQEDADSALPLQQRTAGELAWRFFCFAERRRD